MEKEKVFIELWGSLEKVPYVNKNELLKKEVRYLATDDNYDIYEDVYGTLYATNL